MDCDGDVAFDVARIGSDGVEAAPAAVVEVGSFVQVRDGADCDCGVRVCGINAVAARGEVFGGVGGEGFNEGFAESY